MSERFFREWPAGGAKAVVALVHGLAEHSGRYEHVARALNEAGYAVVAADLTGHGRSEGFPGEVSGLSRWVDDVGATVERARKLSDGGPVFLIGHSLGALVAAAYVARGARDTDGLVLSGIAVLAGTALLAAMSNPDDQGIPPEAVSRDPEVVRSYIEDPLVFYDRVTPEANAAALEAAIEVNGSARSITLPTYVLHGGADQIADVEGAQELFANLGSEDKEIRIYEGLYHECMNEPERDRVLSELIAWLDIRT